MLASLRQPLIADFGGLVVPSLGLALCLFWFLTLFVLRSLILWMNTGSMGINTFKGQIGSLAWCATMCATVGVLIAPMSPLAALYSWPLSAMVFEIPVVHWLGAIIALIGIIGALAAQLAMGESWRIGVDSSERTKLVTEGMFRYVRNPIFSFIGMSMIGFFMTVPNAWSVFAILLTGTGIHLQVKYVEEPYLAEVHGADYETYVRSVGRYLPKLAAR